MKLWGARSWTPELDGGREARSLIDFLFDKTNPQAEWLDTVSSDEPGSEPVRQRALQFARDWKDETKPDMKVAEHKHAAGRLKEPRK